MKIAIIFIIILIPLSLFSQERQDDVGKSIYPEKSYFVAVPLAFFVGFGTGHFYAKDIWGGVRYIAYDIAGLGLGFLTLYFDDYSNRSIILAVAIAVVNRLYQSVSAAEAVYYYNKNPLLREIDLFESERPKSMLSFKSTEGLKLELRF